jgi:radical SAM-linked protein
MTARVPPGPAPAPIVQRLTIRYAKRGRMRFASHRDVARAIERAVRKANVPVAYSAGFSPHPRISYSGGAPTGSASEAEYLEISLTRQCQPDVLGRSLDEALPDGIDVVKVVETDGKSVALQLEASLWEVLVPGVPAEAVQSAADAFLAESSVIVERLTSKGMRKLDARAAVRDLVVDRHVGPDQAAGCAILRMVVQQMTPAVRPDDILTALAQYSELAPASPPVVTRLWQGPLESAAESDTAAKASAIGVTEFVAEFAYPAGRGLAENQATRREAGSAVPAPAGQARANDQLLRGERAGTAGPRAREPNGRDCPNARNRATEPTARPQ